MLSFLRFGDAFERVVIYRPAGLLARDLSHPQCLDLPYSRWVSSFVSVLSGLHKYYTKILACLFSRPLNIKMRTVESLRTYVIYLFRILLLYKFSNSLILGPYGSWFDSFWTHRQERLQKKFSSFISQVETENRREKWPKNKRQGK